ncbi:3-amino-5-hydroxybenoic acid synthesis related protein [Frankia canadensis]|uniref:3-amino-5-hydroxybenoic acid synthesis related protein n=1 Tax=Frankia canadensis TaxID=1836972 RepID=A0A2I2KWG2_9ACTN|nr:3-amino-5-hydroxybenoic acid synthesis related protein [Frankia canadensis]SOU57289.1 3-amino-5-hydroxybenoic acid synthesis related protein [Frankia canadensis]
MGTEPDGNRADGGFGPPETVQARLVAAGGIRRRTVIFDLDGVLVDSFGVMRQAFTIAYAEVVGPGEPPFEEYERHLGRYFPDIMRIMNLPLEMEEPFVRESYRLAREVVLFDGVADMLRTLRERGYGLAVATGKAGPRARHLLGELGVLGLFDHVLGSDEIPRPKPAPDIVLRALDLLGAEPGEAMMIGDAVADLDSARGAGVMAVAALWGETDGVELIAAEPDAILHRPADLLALLGESPAGFGPGSADGSTRPAPDVPAARSDGSPVPPTAVATAAVPPAGLAPPVAAGAPVAGGVLSGD